MKGIRETVTLGTNAGVGLELWFFREGGAHLVLRTLLCSGCDGDVAPPRQSLLHSVPLGAQPPKQAVLCRYAV